MRYQQENGGKKKHTQNRRIEDQRQHTSLPSPPSTTTRILLRCHRVEGDGGRPCRSELAKTNSTKPLQRGGIKGGEVKGEGEGKGLHVNASEDQNQRPSVQTTCANNPGKRQAVHDESEVRCIRAGSSLSASHSVSVGLPSLPASLFTGALRTDLGGCR